MLEYTKHTPIQLKGHPQFNEAWLQDRIAEDPSIIGLGDLELIDRERFQPKAGRLDLLLRDPETMKRYEVELMLGSLDESHIIRALEYWDIERKRFPNYEHCAVVIAEDVTARFLNVIGLFNSVIQIIVIQLNALQIDDNIVLNFIKILDEISLGLEEEEVGIIQQTDRAFWESKGKDGGLRISDGCYSILQEIDPEIKLNYTKNYIGLSRQGKVNNFITFFPKKRYVNIRVKKTIEPSNWRQRLEEAGLDVLESRNPTIVRFSILQDGFVENKELLKELFAEAHQKWFE